MRGGDTTTCRCDECGGRGLIYEEPYTMGPYTCPECGGSGEVEVCDECGATVYGDYCEECFGECASCGEVVPIGEIDEETGFCKDCFEYAEDHKTAPETDDKKCAEVVA